MPIEPAALIAAIKAEPHKDNAAFARDLGCTRAVVARFKEALRLTNGHEKDAMRFLFRFRDGRERIVRMTVMNPEMTPTQIAERLGMSHVTVRKAQREAGVYVPRGVAQELRREP